MSSCQRKWMRAQEFFRACSPRGPLGDSGDLLTAGRTARPHSLLVQSKLVCVRICVTLP